MPRSSLEAVLLRDRLVVTAGLVALTVLSWTYLSLSMWNTQGTEMALPHRHSFGASYLVFVFVMWSTMMVAMMVPSASPLILMFARLNRTRREEVDPTLPTAFFVSGYVLVWTGYSALATLSQWALHEAALLTPSAATASPLMGGALLVAAGIFQWTPLKEACLAQCRSPLGFLMTHWREGRRGAWIMGIQHGGYCLGCCWVLMALLFVAGVMNVLWMAAITGFVLAEKLLPRGELVAKLGGAVLVAAGLLLLTRSG